MSEGVFVLTNSELRLLKVALAKILYKTTEQKEISDFLHITQPMVSNYIKSQEKISSKIQGIAEEVIKKESPPKFSSIVSFEEIKTGNYNIAETDEIITDNKNEIINDLKKAYELLKEKNIKEILPKIKINIAVKSGEDFGTFSSGFIIDNNHISMYSEIVFNKDKHLITLLKKWGVGAVMNIAHGKYDLKYSELDKDYNTLSTDVDVLLHKGDFGIEPCAYVIGKNAIDVAKKVIKVVDI